MRLFLAILVYISHVSSLNVGRPAVMVFFILSGYWVSQLYASKRGSVFDFWIDRWLRIWPLAAFVAIMWVLTKTVLDLPVPGSLVSTLFLLGLAIRQDDVITVAWSLDIELQFYLLLPFIYSFIARKNLKLLGLGALCAWAAGFWLQSRGFITVLTFAPSFAAGMALHATRWSPSRAVTLASGGVFVLLGVAMASMAATRHLIFKPSEIWWFDSDQTVWTLFLVPFVAANLHQSSTPFDRTLGNLSFPFYLVHAPVVALTMLVMEQGIQAKSVGLMLTIVTTVIVYVAIDRPIESWRLRRRAEAKKFHDRLA